MSFPAPLCLWNLTANGETPLPASPPAVPHLSPDAQLALLDRLHAAHPRQRGVLGPPVQRVAKGHTLGALRREKAEEGGLQRWVEKRYRMH